MRLVRPALALLLSGSLASCAALPKTFAWLQARFAPHHALALKVTPVETQLASAAPTDDGLYLDAKHAIEDRNYAAALDLLEAARDRAKDDVRVLNAFGVVYDKLGRFDLSSRYYRAAKKLDPSSPILAQNLAYSAMLQQSQRGEAPLGLALAQPKYRPGSGKAGVTLAAARQLTLQAPTAAGVTLARPGLTGHPLALIDATGRPGVAEPVRLALAKLGWSAPRGAETEAHAQARTEILYAREASIAAAALARTLPTSVDLKPCDNGCEGVRLILGADAALWKDRLAHRKV